MLLDMLSYYSPVVTGPLDQGKAFIARCFLKGRVLIPFYHSRDTDEVCLAIVSGGGANLLSSTGNFDRTFQLNSVPVRTKLRIAHAPLLRFAALRAASHSGHTHQCDVILQRNRVQQDKFG
jgi:hypothetical protein